MADKGKVRRAFEVTRVARRTHLLSVLREVGVVGDKPATREGAVRFREGLEELGTTFVKLGQLLSSRPDLLPDVYIDELTKLVDDVPPLPFAPLRAGDRPGDRARALHVDRRDAARDARRSRRSTPRC